MRIAMGDSEHRQRELRRKATDQIFAEEREMDGSKIFGAFMKGATRVADDFIADTIELEPSEAIMALRRMRERFKVYEKKPPSRKRPRVLIIAL